MTGNFIGMCLLSIFLMGIGSFFIVFGVQVLLEVLK